MSGGGESEKYRIAVISRIAQRRQGVPRSWPNACHRRDELGFTFPDHSHYAFVTPASHFAKATLGIDLRKGDSAFY